MLQESQAETETREDDEAAALKEGASFLNCILPEPENVAVYQVTNSLSVSVEIIGLLW